MRMQDPEKHNPLINKELAEVLVAEKRREQNETLAVLDVLRKTRAARGGVGAPLLIPAHLGGDKLIITDPTSVEEMNEIAKKEAEVERAEPEPVPENED